MSDLDTTPEVEIALRCGETLAATWFCSPAELEELATGWLVGEGVVSNLSDIEALTVVDASTVRATLAHGLADAPDHHPVIPAQRTSRPSDDLAAWVRDRTSLRPQFEEMFGRSPSRRGGGGVHTGALVHGGEIEHVTEDVSRHCLVDKLIGRALRRGLPMDLTILLLSARISGAIAAKACRAGIGAVASMSIPTVPAAEIAARCGLILIGRARRPAPQIHWPAS